MLVLVPEMRSMFCTVVVIIKYLKSIVGGFAFLFTILLG